MSRLPHTETAETARGKQAGHSLPWAWAVVYPLLFYVLSVGPVARITQSYGVGPGWIRTLYAPLIFVADKSSLAGGCLVWYLKLWGVNVD